MGGLWEELQETKSKDDCAKQARDRGYPGFAFGKEEAFGFCYGEGIQVTQQYFDKYELDPVNPAPACGKKKRMSKLVLLVGESLFQHVRHQSSFHGGASCSEKLMRWHSEGNSRKQEGQGGLARTRNCILMHGTSKLCL